MTVQDANYKHIVVEMKIEEELEDVDPRDNTNYANSFQQTNDKSLSFLHNNFEYDKFHVFNDRNDEFYFHNSLYTFEFKCDFDIGDIQQNTELECELITKDAKLESYTFVFEDEPTIVLQCYMFEFRNEDDTFLNEGLDGNKRASSN